MSMIILFVFILLISERSVQKLLALPDNIRVFVGHDYAPPGRDLAWESTIAAEKESNKHIHAGNLTSQMYKRSLNFFRNYQGRVCRYAHYPRQAAWIAQTDACSCSVEYSCWCPSIGREQVCCVRQDPTESVLTMLQ